MTKTPEIPAHFFLAKLTLPVHKLMVRTTVESAARVAEILSFDNKEAFAIKLAVDEAFCNAVDHFSGSAEDERIHLEFYVAGDSLVVSIREKGIPFDYSQAEQYTPGDLESVDKPGLGALLMQDAMDSVEMFVHGRAGKEVRLTKKLRYGAIPPGLMDTKPVTRRRKRPTVKDVEVRLARIEDLSEVCRLAWRCYGFTQEEFLYDLEALTHKVETGEFKSVIAIEAESGALIGHAGFKYHDPSVKVPELGLAFVDPAYRAPGMAMKIGRFLFDMAEAEGDKGIFDCSVTTHTFSQKGIQAIGSRPCCLMLGMAASGMQVRELATSKQEKGSVMNHFFAIDRSPKTIFIPEHHRAMVGDIYEWMDVPREFGVNETEPPMNESAVSVIPLPDELNVSFIIVHTIGKDTEKDVSEGLRQCRVERKDAVYLFLPADVPASSLLVEQCEKMGFFLAGIMPHIHDGQDRVLLQFVDIPIDFDAIRVYGDMSRQLKSYVMSEQERVRNMR